MKMFVYEILVFEKLYFFTKKTCVWKFMKYKWNIYGIKLKINNIKFVVETKKSSFFFVHIIFEM